MAFELHPKLAEDCTFIADLPLCRVLLQRNARFPWIILVPMRENISEIYQLDPLDFEAVMQEVRDVSNLFQQQTQAHKINVAMLGNIVPQLHIHIIARFRHDVAWPKPVWNNKFSQLLYTPEDEARAVALVKEILRPPANNQGEI